MKYKYRYTETYKGIRIDIKSNNKKEMLAKVEEKKAAIDKVSGDAKISLLDFGLSYLDTYKANQVSKDRLRALKSIFKRLLVDAIGNQSMENIKPLDVQRALNKGEWSDDYAKKIYNLACQIWHHAYKNGLTPRDYSEDFVKPKGRPAQRGRSLTAYEQDVLLKVLPGTNMEMMCKFMLFCGLRSGEAREVVFKDIDFDNQLLHVRGTKTKNADRYVPIPDHFMTELLIHKGSPFESVAQVNKQQAERGWRQVKRAMNIEMGCQVYRNKLIPPYPLQEPLRLYDLRHTYATNLEKQGVPITIASRLMGHANISITAQIYTHENDEALETAKKLINKSVESVETTVETMPQTVANTHF